MISVCIAAFNGAVYIREQLVSILAQLPREAEVLLGDDGSSDDTIRIVEQINDFRVKIKKTHRISAILVILKV